MGENSMLLTIVSFLNLNLLLQLCFGKVILLPAYNVILLIIVFVYKLSNMHIINYKKSP